MKISFSKPLKLVYMLIAEEWNLDEFVIIGLCFSDTNISNSYAVNKFNNLLVGRILLYRLSGNHIHENIYRKFMVIYKIFTAKNFMFYYHNLIRFWVFSSE